MFSTFIKQTEVNSGGGIRISVYKQSFGPDGGLIAEQPHQITIGPFDDIGPVIEANNAALEKMGYPAIDPTELELPLALREAAHGHPLVQERMAIEAEKIEAERVASEEREKAAAIEREARETAAAEAYNRRAEMVAKAQQAEADAARAEVKAEMERRVAEGELRLAAMVAAAVAKALAGKA